VEELASDDEASFDEMVTHVRVMPGRVAGAATGHGAGARDVMVFGGGGGGGGGAGGGGGGGGGDDDDSGGDYGGSDAAVVGSGDLGAGGLAAASTLPLHMNGKIQSGGHGASYGLSATMPGTRTFGKVCCVEWTSALQLLGHTFRRVFLFSLLCSGGVPLLSTARRRARAWGRCRPLPFSRSNCAHRAPLDVRVCVWLHR
jgi:hypothetical protein